MEYRGLRDSLVFIRRLEELQIDGRPLREHRVLGQYDFTPFITQELIFAHAETFMARGGTISELRRRRRKGLIEATAAGLFAVMASVIGIAAICIRRRRVLLYAADTLSSGDRHHDFRLDRVYQAMERLGTPYAECLHTPLSRRTVFNYFKRKRAGVFFLESIDFLFRVHKFIFGQKFDFNPDELGTLGVPVSMGKYFVTQYVTALRLAAGRIRGLSLVFKILPVRKIFTVDYPSHYGAMLVAAKRNDIRVAAFQHGHFTKYHLGWLMSLGNAAGEVPRPDIIYVWSGYWKNELLRLGTFFKPEEIGVSGYGNGEIPELSERRRDLSLLIPYETSSSGKEIHAFLERVSGCGAVTAVFKTRPDVKIKAQLSAYGFSPTDPFVLDTEPVFQKALEKSSAVIGTYSTLIYDAILRGLPAGVLKTENDFGEGLWKNGLATLIDMHSVTLCEDVRALADLSEAEMRRRREMLMSEGGEKIFYEMVSRELGDLQKKNAKSRRLKNS